MLSVLVDNFYLGLFVSAYLGLIFGSFSTAIIYRTSHGKSWVWNKGDESNKGRSFCPSCSHILGLKDLVPVFSWLFQKGKCRYCKTSISLSYFLIELSSLLISIVIWQVFNFSLLGVLLVLISPFVLSQFILLFKDKIISPILCIIISSFIAFYILFLIY